MKTNITNLVDYENIVVESETNMDYVVTNLNNQTQYKMTNIMSRQELIKKFNQEGYFFTGAKFLCGKMRYCFTKKLN